MLIKPNNLGRQGHAALYDSGALLFLSPPGGPFDPTTYDDLGRMIDLHVTYKF